MTRCIEGEARLTAVFGRWPSFHDAEVWKLAQERTPEGFAVTATIHVFGMTAETDARGYFKLARHTLVTLRFDDCADVRLEGFNRQNVLSSLTIAPDGAENAVRPFTVVFESSFGLDGRLACRAVEVVEVIPWIPPHGVSAPTGQ